MKYKREFFAVTRSVVFRWRYVWLIIGAAILGAAFYFDADVVKWMTSHQTPAARAFMRNVSRWGDWPSHAVVGLVGAGVAYALGNRRWVTIFAAMIVACALAGLVNRVVKIGAGRARPSVQVDTGWKGPRFSSNYHAFPSGHTASSSAFFATLFFARRRIGLVLLPIPLLIAASRLYLGAHYLSDVVFAAILGVACAFVVWRFISGRFISER